MVAARSPHFVPYEEFLAMEEASEGRHEWVDGVVYAMSRGTPEHGRLTGRVIGLVLTPLLAEGCELFASDTPIFIEAARHHTYADASSVCGPLVTRTMHDKNGRSIGDAIVNPTLIVEVLSEGTERYDRDGKFEAYKKIPSFREYVLGSQAERRIEVRTLHEGVWTTLIAGEGETIRIHGRDMAVDTIYK
ncbi:Uma2 family endonuclease [Pendulispora albinea]|uniref:Uma2 family endonuclease n=1 Tax=Pendulispora albinea TaxID=2741071 RepID=A0ABZ2LSX8_9BACT